MYNQTAHDGVTQENGGEADRFLTGPHAHLKQTLETQLTKLLSRMGQIEDAINDREEPDFEEQAWESQADGVLEELSVVHMREARQVVEALRKMRNGTYGICTVCAEDIPPARLAAIPHASTCVNCAGLH